MSLGDTLRRAREARRISLNQAALETRIRQTVLETLEAEDFAALPPRPFLRGLLRNYALYLHLDADSVLEEYDVATGHALPPAPRAAQPDDTNESPAAPPMSPPASTPETTARGGEAFSFPPFQIAPSAKAPEFIQAELEPMQSAPFQMAPDMAADEQAATAPLNLSQEPPTFAQRIGSTRIPEAVAIVAIAVALFALVSVGFSTLQNFPNPLGALPTAEPTRIPTATIPAGSTPTAIPTILETVLPTSALAAIPATASATPTGGTLEPTQVVLVTPTLNVPPDAQMTLVVEANGAMGVWVIVDEDSVLNDTLQNETRTFTAHSRLFVQIKNIGNGRVFFQGTRILPRDQQERSELSRAWLMSPLGTPVIVPPTPYPSPVAATEFPTRTPQPTETATQTATNEPSATATDTLTPTPTITRTATATATRTTSSTTTRTLTATSTATRTRTATPTALSTRTRTTTPTASSTRTATSTRTPTR